MTHEYLREALRTLPAVRAGAMFGYPAWFVNGKMFACLYRSGVGIKVPANIASELRRLSHIHDFRPYGKPRMREGIEIRRRPARDLREDSWIFERSMKFVRDVTQGASSARRRRS